MKYLLPSLSVIVLLVLLAPQASASTSIDISNNGEGSHTSVSVHSSTGGNYVNGQEVSGSNGSSTTKVTVNGKTYVDQTTDGSHSTDVSVKAEGNKEPEVQFNGAVKSDSTSSDNDSDDQRAADLKAAMQKKQADQKAAVEAKLAKAHAEALAHQATFLGKIEAFFTHLRSLFGMK